MTYLTGVERVDDPTDDRLADYAGLSDADARRRIEGPGGEGIFVAEGALVIRRLIRSPYRIRSLLVSERGLRGLEPALADVDAPVYLAAQAVIDAVTGFNFHRGALATADRRPLPDPATLVAGADRLLLVEGIGDHENLGALFRNAAAFGVDAVLLDPTAADPLYRRSVRVSAGHVLAMPFTRMPDWPAGALAGLRAHGFEVVALTPSTSADDLRDLPPRPRRALMVGAEGDGLSVAALAAADQRVRITMSPAVDSLNVATAAAIALHHLAG
jgi:tRNA G18 (ribose-2'-O)-methylase SpoU